MLIEKILQILLDDCCACMWLTSRLEYQSVIVDSHLMLSTLSQLAQHRFRLSQNSELSPRCWGLADNQKMFSLGFMFSVERSSQHSPNFSEKRENMRRKLHEKGKKTFAEVSQCVAVASARELIRSRAGSAGEWVSISIPLVSSYF